MTKVENILNKNHKVEVVPKDLNDNKELTKVCGDTKLSFHILSGEKMTALGFHMCSFGGTRWYKSRKLSEDLSLIIMIPINDVEESQIYVLDETFGQPYDYQSISGSNPLAETCRKLVECEMVFLLENGVLK